MAKPRKEKETAVAEIKGKLEEAPIAVLTDYRGLTVAEITELRRKFREAGIDYKVVKNTLTWRAAKEVGLDDLEEYLEGPTAIAFGKEDPVEPAKIISDFAKDHKSLEIKGGILDNKVLPLEEVKALADLPSEEQLLAQVAGALQAPIANLANVLQAPIREFVMVTDAVRQEKEKEA